MAVEDAYLQGTSSMRLFNAYGTSTVLLNNHYFEGRDGRARYEYGTSESYLTFDSNGGFGCLLSSLGVVISTSPYMNLVCDIAGNQTAYTPCRGVLLLNVPGFDSTIIRERTALNWTVSLSQDQLVLSYEY